MIGDVSGSPNSKRSSPGRFGDKNLSEVAVIGVLASLGLINISLTLSFVFVFRCFFDQKL